MTNDVGLQSRVLAAGARAGERLWPLPMIDEYREGLRSEVADLRNTGPRPGGAITAGLFIREFAGDTPWVHLDIAGVAFTDKDLPYAPKGGVGFGARTLIEYVLAAEGISHFMLWFVDTPDQAGLRLFAEQVAPQFRS